MRFPGLPMIQAPNPADRVASKLVNGLLSIKPLAQWAKQRARSMMIQRAESIGVHWFQEVEDLKAQALEAYRQQVQNPELNYPDYYLRSFHAYEQGNLGWEPATEVEVAAHAVHARIWPDAGAEGDSRLRRSFLDAVQAQIESPPQDILDLGCSVGMSTFVWQEIYPQAQLTGVDLSPYFLAVAQIRQQQRQIPVTWVHAPAEATGLPEQSFDLVSACLMFHELPQSAARQILREARRVLRPQGYLAVMDMNPRSEIYAQMPPFILTLLKSTEPYLDQYMSLDLEQEIEAAGFSTPQVLCNTPRHRTLIAQTLT